MPPPLALLGGARGWGPQITLRIALSPVSHRGLASPQTSVSPDTQIYCFPLLPSTYGLSLVGGPIDLLFSLEPIVAALVGKSLPRKANYPVWSG